MNKPDPDQISGLLAAWSEGDPEALTKLVPLVHEELHRLARSYMRRERRDHTLQTTGLLNEAYLRLAQMGKMKWTNRTHFYAICARLMRRILVDFARSRQYLKRGGKTKHISLDQNLLIADVQRTDLVELDQALTSLEEMDPRKARVVEMRFFGGMTVEETAQALDVSPDTVMRDWKMAKAWLLRALTK